MTRKIRVIYKATPEEKAKFWSNVDIRGEDDCWPWKRRWAHASGYGKFYRKSQAVCASRFAYVITHGRLRTDRLVLHSCDNPKCCNPKHLRAGTHADNMRDKVERRRARGKPGPRRFTAADVRSMRALAQTVSVRSIAGMYGIGQTSMRNIVIGRFYKDVV